MDIEYNMGDDPDDIFLEEEQTTKQQTQYTKNIYNPLVNYMFDNNYIEFIEAVADNAETELKTILGFKNIFHMIKEHNKWASIFPENEDIKKTEFNDEILDYIFNNEDNKFHFKNLTRTSKPYMILRDMLAKEFKNPIIETKTKDKIHYTFMINDKKREILEYSLKTMNI